ncbi:hypothetical protein CEXT_269411 [Caerostris extrusa]|uniref:Uncharacterized protein n=1 Tax=Caerostris extrusa TaxID=172846 RepID=A0AAV4SCB0_CAEEX|nr:hypothetical protein CEXT_269411 [Caerostris extrusa]
MGWDGLMKSDFGFPSRSWSAQNSISQDYTRNYPDKSHIFVKFQYNKQHGVIMLQSLDPSHDSTSSLNPLLQGTDDNASAQKQFFKSISHKSTPKRKESFREDDPIKRQGYSDIAVTVSFLSCPPPPTRRTT